MSDHKSLQVWHKSMDLVVDIYRITKFFPGSEKYGLVSQIRRSAVSIPSNIAEGSGRKSDGNLIHFLKIAYGSSSELETQLLISHRLEFIAENDFDALAASLTEVRVILNKLISNLTNS